jgi:hypothetical protein
VAGADAGDDTELDSRDELRYSGWVPPPESFERNLIWIVESEVFTRNLLRVATDEDYRQFQIELARNPEAGDVILGLGGLRKIRMKLGSRGKGKRGGARVIYYWFGDDRIAFLTYL